LGDPASRALFAAFVGAAAVRRDQKKRGVDLLSGGASPHLKI
jgi:hypothetical protein